MEIMKKNLFITIISIFIIEPLLNVVKGQSFNVETFATSISTPYGIALDSRDNVIVAERYSFRVKKISQSAVVTTLAGSGVSGILDAYGTYSRLGGPLGVAVDLFDNIYVCEDLFHVIRKISNATGYVSTIAGLAGVPGFQEGHGTNARFHMPYGMHFDRRDQILLVGSGGGGVFRLTTTGNATLVAGSGVGGFADGYGTTVKFAYCTGIALYASNILVADQTNNRIRMIAPDGNVTTFAGSGTAAVINGYRLQASFNGPHGIAADKFDNIYISDRSGNTIRRIDAAGNVLTIASGFDQPLSMAFDSNDNSYISDRTNNRVMKIIICYPPASYDSLTKSCICPMSCRLCPTGNEFNSEQGTCVPCSLGKYRSTLNSNVCSPCSIGTESGSDFNSCVSCSSGKYRPSLDHLVCIDCPLLATCNSTAIVSCQTGYKINSAKTGCEQCPIGTQSAGDFLSCVSCTVGTNYRSSLSQSSCQSCPANSVCSTFSSFTCNVGYELTQDGLGCSLCQDGYSKSASGNVACSQCSIGTESVSNRQSCSNCAAGYYRSSLANPRCILCPTGATCSNTAVTRCANGFKKNTDGDGCDQCSIGQDSTDGVNCVNCVSGYFKPDQSYSMCIKCPDGSSCGGSTVSCQTGYFYDFSAQCKRNDTYFALLQTATNTLSTITSFVTLTQPASTTTETSISITTSTSISISTISTSIFATATVSQSILPPTLYTKQVITVSFNNYQTVTVSAAAGPSQQQAQSANSVTLDFIGTTLPISPLIFAAIAFGAGFFIMLIMSLICCRRSHGRRKDEEFDAPGMTTTMNTQSQRTFTNSSMR